MADTLANHIIRTYDIDTSHIVGLYMTANVLSHIKDDNTTVTPSPNPSSHPEKKSETQKSEEPSPVSKTLEDQLKELGIK